MQYSIGVELIDPDCIHQVYISSRMVDKIVLPEIVDRNISSLRKLYPSSIYRLWFDDEIRNFISSQFGASVLDAYNSLSANTAKSDLVRYCLLWHYGGLYSDLSNLFLSKLTIREWHKIAYFCDAEPYGSNVWGATATIVYARPRQPEMMRAIEMVVRNAESKFYGANPLCPTGPVLFGSALAVENKKVNYWCGKMIALTGTYPQRNHAFVDGDDTIIALRIQSEGGRSSELGLRGTNDYNDLWKRGVYYGERRVLSLITRNFRSRHIDRVGRGKTSAYGGLSRSGGRTVIAGGASHRHIFHLWSDDAYSGCDDFKVNYAEDKGVFYSESDVLVLMGDYFEPRVREAYELMADASLRHDFSVLVILMVRGGMYVRPSVNVINIHSIACNKRISVFRLAGQEFGRSWGVDMALLSSLAGQDEVGLAIDLICTEVLRSDGRGPSYVEHAGEMLGRALAIWGDSMNYWCGDTIPVPHPSGMAGPCLGLISPKGQLVGYRNA